MTHLLHMGVVKLGSDIVGLVQINAHESVLRGIDIIIPIEIGLIAHCALGITKHILPKRAINED